MDFETVMLGRFEDLIRARAGLSRRPQESPVLLQALRARVQKLRLPDSLAYLDLLDSDSPAAHSEWKQLWMLLTNQESYFFRDADQLSLVGRHILPELMRRNRDTRTLRLWSAGCSTGEETYSLAMMLDEVPELRDWHVTILGTDLSDAALQRARRGLYGSWSFRALDARRQERFFLGRGKEWEVAPHLRQKVVFASNNLFGDPFPSFEGEIHDMDLILCRNVFIYFGRDAIAGVLKKFSATLRPGGFLVCGHAELHDVPLGDLSARAFPQSVIYSRDLAPREKTAVRATLPAPQTAEPLARQPFKSPPKVSTQKVSAQRVAPAPISDSTPTVTKATSDPLSTASQIVERATLEIRTGQPAQALEMLQTLLAREPGHLAAWCVMAQAQANSGQLDAAESSCMRALSISPFAVLPYHLQARIAEERGQSEIAKSLLKKVIYLHPRSVWAALELASIYRREGDLARAAQLRGAARGLLDDLADDSPVMVAEYAVEAPLPAGELKRQLQSETVANSVIK